jgi:hypothetical protein
MLRKIPVQIENGPMCIKPFTIDSMFIWEKASDETGSVPWRMDRYQCNFSGRNYI